MSSVSVPSQRRISSYWAFNWKAVLAHAAYDLPAAGGLEIVLLGDLPVVGVAPGAQEEGKPRGLPGLLKTCPQLAESPADMPGPRGVVPAQNHQLLPEGP